MSKKRVTETNTQPKKKKKITKEMDETTILPGTPSVEKEPATGIIESISLFNLMCHETLHLDFHPNLNIINGENGSGKSAIITGLQLCLGSKASKTNRTDKLGEIIKTGEENTGVDAYKPETYGEKIIIERKIEKNNTSSYKIKSVEGEVISKKRSDLQLILDQLNIQIDNPCTIMTQDISRKFLGSSSLKDKYEFFMKATQLKKMLEDYDFSNQNQDILETILKNKNIEFEEKIREFKELENEYTDVLKLETFEKEIEELTSSIGWALVKEKEINVQKYDERIGQEEEKLNSYISKHKTETEDIEKYEKERANIETKLDETTNELQKITDETTETTSKISIREKEKAKSKAKVRELESKISSEKKNIEKIQYKIKSIKEKVKVDRNAELEKREKSIKSKQTELDNVKSDLEEKNQKKEQINAELEEIKKEYSENRQTLSISENHYTKTNSDLNSLKKSQSDKISYFKDRPERLLDLIEKNKNKFSKIPIGPLGLLLTLKDKSWGFATESLLGGNLHTFVVDNLKDGDLLKNLANSLKMQTPNIIVTRFTSKVYDYKPMDGFNAFIDNILIDKPYLSKYVKWDERLVEPTVINVLIDFHSIESVIYLENRKEAYETLKDNDRLHEAWSKDGSKLVKQGGGGSIVTHTNNGKGKLWVESFEKQIKKLENETREINEEIEKKKSLLNQTSQKKNKLEADLSKINGEISKLNRYKYGLERDIEQIKNDVPEEEKDDTPIINEYEEQIQEKKKNIEQFEKDIEQSKESVEQNEKEIKEIEKEEKKFKEKKRKIEEEIQKYQNELEKLIKEQSVNSAKKSNFEKNVQKYKESIRLLSEKRDTLKEKAEEAKKEALNLCPIPKEVNESSSSLTQKKEHLILRLNKERERFVGGVENLKKNYENAKNNVKSTKKALDISGKNLEYLKNGLKKRMGLWEDIRQHFSEIITIKFNEYLTQRGHSGEVEFNHDKSELEIKVKTEMAKQLVDDEKSIQIDTKGLSGGERSFSTVSFLLSLWEVVESPFRVVDEFDIFMDSVYRKQSMDILINSAKTKFNDRQLIIITPHEISQIKVGSDIKIFHLKKPERIQGQTILDQYSQKK